jgi:hypothetical protein
VPEDTIVLIVDKTGKEIKIIKRTSLVATREGEKRGKRREKDSHLD